MPPFASGASLQADHGISPKLMIAIAVLFALFLAVIIGFRLAASKKCCPPRTSTTDRPSPAVPESCHHTPRRQPVRRGLAQPVASIIPKCPAHKNVHSTADKTSRDSQESIRSSQTPSPYYARRAPTGVLPTQTWPSSTSHSSPALHIMPRSRPLGHRARGPTATLRPVVW